MKDGLVLFYVKKDVVYPVALSKDSYDMLQILGNTVTFGKALPVLFDKPIGKAIDLIKSK